MNVASVIKLGELDLHMLRVKLALISKSYAASLIIDSSWYWPAIDFCSFELIALWSVCTDELGHPLVL